MSAGLHEIVVVTYPDGREERRECPCDWCDIWRAFAPAAIAKLDAWVLDHEPAVRPEWLGPPSEDA